LQNLTQGEPVPKPVVEDTKLEGIDPPSLFYKESEGEKRDTKGRRGDGKEHVHYLTQR